jgi:hypothetical protein
MITYYGLGDALKADRIFVSARDIGEVRYGEGSHRDRIQFTKLRGSAFCVIELPLKSVRERGGRT